MQTRIVRENGVLQIEADGKILQGLAFKSFRPTDNNVGDFYRAGVRIFHVFCSSRLSALKVPYSVFGETWFGPHDYRFENLDRQIDFFKRNAPEAHVFINVHLDNREWWRQQHNDAPDSFTHLSQVAGDEDWRQDTADYLQALIKHTEEKYDDYVIGYFLLGGTTTEWFSDRDYEAAHPIKTKAYKKYRNDPAAEIPDTDVLEKDAKQIFLDPAADRDLITYRRFHNELIADTVLYFAEKSQEVLGHKKIVGVFFGYILELHGKRMWNAGHMDFDRVYQSKDIDLFATPSSYQFRAFDQPSAAMLLSDTLEMHGKMYFISFDHTTFKLATLPDDKRRLCANEPGIPEALRLLASMRAGNKKEVLKTRHQTIEAMRREFMGSISKRTAMWWFDMLEGWFYDDALMEEVRHECELYQRYLRLPRKSVSEVAVFVDGESLYYVNKMCEINSPLICSQRGGLMKMGAPFDIYSLADLTEVDETPYKLVIFLDAFRLSDDQREYIQKRLKKDGRSLLFIKACDYVQDGALSIRRMEEMLEMRLGEAEQEETEIWACNSQYGHSTFTSPTWYVADEKAEILGRYAIGRQPALARMKKDGYTVYFSGLGNLSDAVLREIARKAGVFLYTRNGEAVFVNEGFTGVYNTGSEETAVAVRSEGVYREIFTGREYASQNGFVTLPTGEHPAQMLVRKG